MKKRSKKMSSMKSYKNGGKMKMYQSGGGLGTAGSVMQAAAPFVGMIPGIGMIASPLVSMAGGLMSQEQDKRDLREANAETNVKNFLSQNIESRRGAYGFMQDGGQLVKMEGPSHEEGGIKLPQFGAELEGGETVNKDNMFVNSDHLGYDKDGYPTMNPKAVKTTFADKSKKIENKYKNKRSYEELMGEKFSQKMVNKANEKVKPPEPSQDDKAAMLDQLMNAPGLGQQGMQAQGMQQPPMGEEMPMEGQMPAGEEGAMPAEMMPGQMRMGGSLYKKYQPGGYLPPMPAVDINLMPQNPFLPAASKYTPYQPFSGVTQPFNQSLTDMANQTSRLSQITPVDLLPTMAFKYTSTMPPFSPETPATNTDGASSVEGGSSRGISLNGGLKNKIQSGLKDANSKYTMGDKMNLIGAGLGMASQIPSMFVKPEKAIARMTNPQLNYNRYNTTPEMQASDQAFRNYANQINSSTSNSGARTARLLAGLANTNQQQSNILRQANTFNNQVEQQNAAAINQARQMNAREAARIDDINSSNAAAAAYSRQQAGVNMGQQLAQTGQYFNQLDSQKLQLGILNDMYANYGLSATDLNNLLKNLAATGQIATYKTQQGK